MKKVHKAFGAVVKATVGSKIEVLVPKGFTRLVGFAVSATEKVELTLETDAANRFLHKAEFAGRELNKITSNSRKRKLARPSFHAIEQRLKPNERIRGVVKGVTHAFTAAVDDGRLSAPEIFVTVLLLFDNDD